MAWTKAPQSLVDLFTESLPDDPRIERRKMFGFPSVFVGGNMCAGLSRTGCSPAWRQRTPMCCRAALNRSSPCPAGR